MYKVRDQRQPVKVEDSKQEELRSKIEPWLAALFQSEHLSLLLGGGISSAVHWLTKNQAGAEMAQIPFSVFQNQIDNSARESARKSGRGEPNIEDQIRVCNELIKGLSIYVSDDVYGLKKIRKNLAKFKQELSDGLTVFANLILECESDVIQSPSSDQAAECLDFPQIQVELRDF